MNYLSKFARLFIRDYSDVKQEQSLPQQETEIIILYTPMGYIDAGHKLMREEKERQRNLESSLNSN
ncbi:MAG: hypothetical protein AABX48_02965 [Nanoarchaeota archaeon]